jgi:ABC-2 type transport system ATP-binding protein
MLPVARPGGFGGAAMIELKEVGFRYTRTSKPLFQGLDLQLTAGTICGLLGANGAGKSTLLRLLAGLSFPQQGSCRVFGFAPADRLPAFLADIFLLPEEIFVAPVTPAVYAHRYAGFYPRFDHAIYDKLLADFSLPADRKLSEYSYGQKKKFLLAFGIATNARLLIMDEPTNGLDIPGKAHFRRALINHFAPERSFLISTHQVHARQGLIDSVMVVADGNILLHAPLDALSARLQVEVEEQAPSDALYFEESLEGYRVVRENTSGAGADLDLELLFGLATNANLKLQQLLGARR